MLFSPIRFPGRGLSRTCVLVLGLVTWGTDSAVSAPTRVIPADGAHGAPPPSVRVLESTPDRLSLSFELPVLIEEVERSPGSTRHRLAIPEGGELGRPGGPLLPVFTRLVAIPDEVGVQCSFVSLESEDRAAPTEFWSGSGRDDTGSDLVEIGRPALMRGLRVVPVRFRPVTYDPSRNILRVHSRLRVDLRFEGEDLENARPSRPDAAVAPSFDRLCRELVLNYGDREKSDRAGTGTWLLIAPNDPAVTNRLQPLLDWRKRRGMPVRLATTAETGTSTAQIKFYLQNAYLNWPVPPEFVVLAGDASGTYQIPTWFEGFSGYGGEGDHPYAQLEGNDVLADVHLGRLSFNTLGELETIVAKLVGYERDPYVDDATWFKRACLTGDPNASGWSTVHVMQWIKAGLRHRGYAEIDTIFGDPFVAQMQTALNRGDTIFAYRGYWGMSGWTNSLTYALLNGRRLPFSIISTCGTGSFAAETALSEGFLRAGSATTPRGAIGAIGTATLGTHTRFNNTLTMGIMQGLLYEETYHLGAALSRGKLELFLNYDGSDQAIYVDIFSHWNNLMGDPATECWTGFPELLAVSHPTSMAVGDHALSVGVSGPEGPAAGALVCAWKTAGLGGPEVYLTALTDEEGNCELPVALSHAGDLLLTVTKHDHRPYLATIPVTPQPLVVGYQSAFVDDDNAGESAGNGDGWASPLEALELRIQLRNFGTQLAPQVTAVLSSADPYVAITDDTEEFGDLPGGQSAWCADDFGLTIDPDCPDGHLLTLELQILSPLQEWRNVFTLPVASARPAVVAAHVHDDGNETLDPGESADFSVVLRNDGTIPAANTTVELTSLSPWISVLDSSGTFGTIPPGAEAENLSDRFRLHASPQTFPGHQAEFLLLTRFNGGAIDTASVAIEVGSRASTDPAGPDRYGYVAFDDTDTAYEAAPEYAWIELDPALGGNGTELPLGDYGHYQDKSGTVELPFAFRFYGEERTHATICSNGWIALTPTHLTVYRNTTIPGAGAPSDLVAVFWDDLYQDGSSRVFHAYDPVGHRWIVEWSRFRNLEDGSLETFEAILLDPRFHDTDTGDGAILFQYQTIANVDVLDGYATVGIQDFDHTDGLLYSYFNQYEAGAATLEAERAILFQPVIPGPRGGVEGIVRNESLGGLPLAGAQVSLYPGGRTFPTAADGSFEGGVATGAYLAVASHAGFAPDSVLDVVVSEGEIVHLELALMDDAGPTISAVTEPGHTSDTAGPYNLEATASDPSGVASVGLFYRLDGGEWHEVPMTGAGPTYAAGIPGAPAGTEVEYYISAIDGAGLGACSPPGAPAEAYTLLITTVAYSYAGEGPSDAGWTIGLPEDDALRGIWTRADPLASWFGGELIQPDDDHTPDPGIRCLVTANVIPGGTDPEGDVDGGCTTVLSPVIDLSTATSAWVEYWRWFGEMGDATDDELAVDVSNDGGVSWAPLERVPESDPSWRQVTRDLGAILPLTGQMRLRCRACDLGEPTQLEAAWDDLSIEVFVPGPTSALGSVSAGAIDALVPGRPNPFAGMTTIRYHTAKTGKASLAIFDVHGRVIRRLWEGPCPAGEHQASWDGRDTQGSAAPAGVYFVRLETAGYRGESKLLVVR